MTSNLGEKVRLDPDPDDISLILDGRNGIRIYARIPYWLNGLSLDEEYSRPTPEPWTAS